jgi:hypothetical protein
MADVDNTACDIKNMVENIKLMLHCRNNDIIFLKKDRYNKQAFMESPKLATDNRFKK